MIHSEILGLIPLPISQAEKKIYLLLVNQFKCYVAVHIWTEKNGKYSRLLTIPCLHNSISCPSHIYIFTSFFFMQCILGLYPIISSSCIYSEVSPFIL